MSEKRKAPVSAASQTDFLALKARVAALGTKVNTLGTKVNALETKVDGLAPAPAPTPAPTPALEVEDLTRWHHWVGQGITSFPKPGAFSVRVDGRHLAPWDSTCNFAGISRSQIGEWPADAVCNWEFDFRIQPDSTFNPDPSSWMLFCEVHSNDDVGTSPPFSIHLDAGKFGVFGVYGPAPSVNWLWDLYHETEPLPIGVWYHIKVECLFNLSNGYMKLWRNGVQLVNYSGPLGYGSTQYLMLDTYRAATPHATGIDFENVQTWTGTR